MRIPALLTALFLLAGCSGGLSSAGAGMPVSESTDDIPGEFEILGEVTPTSAAARSSYGNRDTGLQEARRTASTMGADAVLIVLPNDESNNSRIRDFLSNPMTGGLSAPRTAVQKRYLAIRVVPTAGAAAEG